MPEDRSELDALALMRARFKDAEEADTLNRVAAIEAISFYFGDQWRADIKAARDADGRPCFTLNKLPSIVRQVLNDFSEDPPAIEIEAESDGADEDSAEARQGLARHVEQHSDAALAYENGFFYLTLGGFGSWRVNHDYVPGSMNQECAIEPIWNPFSVYWDPASQHPDKRDARYCFVTHDLSVDDHNAQYKKSELVGRSDFAGLGDQAPGWLSKDGARVVEYFYVETEDATLVQLVDGRCVYDDAIPPGAKVAVGDDGEPVSRPDLRRRLYVAHSNGIEWLKKPKEQPTDDIPIVTVYGERVLVNDEMRVKGAVFDLQQAQELFNYDSSAIGETMALGTKAQWIATAEQIEPYQELWRQANARNLAVLPYRNVPNAPPPTKVATEPPIMAMSAARLQASDDLRSISGVYDATQSPAGGEESGRAILARRHQAKTGNSHFRKNVARGVKRTADILLKLFPIIYDTARHVHITGADQQKKQIIVHGGRPDTIPAALPDGIKSVVDLSVGKFAVSVGRAYDTMREETIEMMLALVGAEPNLAPIIGDLIVNEMQFPNKKAFVDRLQRALPPGLQDPKEATDPSQLQAHNGALMAANQKLMAQVQQLTQMMQSHQLQNMSREKVEQMKLQAASIRAQAALDQERIKAQASILTQAAGKHFDAVHDHALATKAAVHGMMDREHAAALAPPPAGMTQ